VRLMDQPGMYAPVERVDLSAATRSPQDVWHSDPLYAEWARGCWTPRSDKRTVTKSSACYHRKYYGTVWPWIGYGEKG
jgi:hypothetical protein